MHRVSGALAGIEARVADWLMVPSFNGEGIQVTHVCICNLETGVSQAPETSSLTGTQVDSYTRLQTCAGCEREYIIAAGAEVRGRTEVW